MFDINNYDSLTQSKLEQAAELWQYKPANAKILAFHKSNSKTRLLLGGKRSSKTFSSIVEVCWAGLGIHPYLDYPKPPLQIRYCTVDYNAVFRIALPYFKRFLYPWAWDGHCSKDHPMITLANGTEIEFMSYESDLEAYEGVSRHLIAMDEEPPLDVYQSNFMRTIDVGGKLTISCTPLHGLSWLFFNLYDNPEAIPPAVEHWHVKTSENPYILKEEIESVKANPAMRDNLEAALEGEFIPKSGLVFKSFSDKNILPSPIKVTEDYMILLGIDPHDRNPWGVVFVAFNRENQYIVYDEILQAGTVPEVAAEIKKKLNGRKPQMCVMDTSGNVVQGTSGKSFKEMLMPYGLYCQDADKRVSEGILEVNSLLDQGKDKNGKDKKPRLFITPNCVHLKRQFRSCIWEDWSRNRNQKDPKERILKRDDHLLDCFDDQTEILTISGWKYFKDLKENEQVATLNSNTDILEYQLITGYVDRSYSGKMLLCDGLTTNFCVTPTHRLYSSRQYNYKVAKNYKFELGTIDKFGVEFPIKKNAQWTGHKIDYFTLPSYVSIGRWVRSDAVIPMHLWLQFLGLFLSEGFVNASHYQTYIAQSYNSGRFKEIYDILSKLPLNFKYDEKLMRFYCMNKDLYEYCKLLGKSATKYIPREYFLLNRELLHNLWYGLMLGDGTFKDRSTYSNDKYDSASYRLINDVQELAIKIGKYGNVNHYKGAVQMLSPANNKLYYDCADMYRINFSKRNGYTTVNVKRNVQEIDYSGRVYCVEVPNHIIYTRREGKPMWSGNSLRYTVMIPLVYRHPSFGVKSQIPEKISKVTAYF